MHTSVHNPVYCHCQQKAVSSNYDVTDIIAGLVSRSLGVIQGHRVTLTPVVDVSDR